MRGHGEIFQIGDQIEMKLRRLRPGLNHGRFGDVRNFEHDHYVTFPEKRRIQQFVRPNELRLIQRQADIERDRFQFRDQQPTGKNIAYERRNPEFSKIPRRRHSTKTTQNQPTMKEIYATAVQEKGMHNQGYSGFNDAVAAQPGGLTKWVHSLPLDIVSLPKFLADFAKECFDPPREVPKRKAKVENHETDVVKAPEAIRKNLLQNNSVDADEEKEVLGTKAQSNISNREIPQTADLNNRQHPEPNFTADRHSEVRERSMSIYMSTDNPRGRNSAAVGWKEEFNVKIFRKDR